jgi:hypothetical protein
MAVYQARSHAVDATRITAVGALTRGGQLVHPDDGLLLTLSDNAQRKWLIEGEATPHVGDWLVVDPTMHASYVVNPAKFAELFDVTA